MDVENFKKISPIKSRVLQYIDYKSFNKLDFFRKLKISNTNFHGRNAKSELGGDKIFEILNYCSDLSPEWLLTGHGEMTRKSADQNSININQNKNRVAYNSIYSNELVTSKEKDLMVDIKTQLTEQKQSLEIRLADKDKQIESLERQIEDLKINMERLISEKSEVIKMKDEMLAMKEEAIKGKEATLAAKDEIISIQSRRIADFESHRGLEEAKKIYLEQTMSGNVMSSERDLLPDVVRIEEKKIPRTERTNF